MDRVDTEALLAGVDLLALLARDTPLQRVARTDGGEYAGPCPGCGGRDRFRVWPAPREGPGRYWCRQCGAKGDAISYLRWREGLSFADACARLGALPQTTARPSLEQPPPQPDAVPPPAEWQARALQVVTEAHLRLLRDPAAARARAYLAAQRGLRPEAWGYGRLGFVPGRGYARGHGLCVPAGILIPWFCAGVLWMVNVRRPTNVPGQRYRRIAVGDGQPHQGGLYQAWTVARGRPVLVTEGEFDALLAYQVVGDLAGVVTPGAATNGVPARWLPLLAGAPAILSAHDADAAGQQGAARLGALSARVRRLALPAGQDLTDFVRSGGDLRALVAAALCR